MNRSNKSFPYFLLKSPCKNGCLNKSNFYNFAYWQIFIVDLWVTSRSLSALGRFLGFFVNATFTKLWKLADHFSLSLSVGGLKPLFDIMNKARIGWRLKLGGCNSANSIAVIPTAQISHCWLYPPFLSTAATSGAFLNSFLHYVHLNF